MQNVSFFAFCCILLTKLSAFEITWEYDSKGQLFALIESKTRISQFEYDDANHLSKMIKPDGVILYYQVDKEGNLKKCFSSDNSVSYKYNYDSKGTLVSIDNLVQQRTTSFQFDKEGELLSHTQENGLTLRYAYPNPNVFEIFFPDHSSISYSLDSLTRKGSSGETVYTQSIETKEDNLSEISKGEWGTISFHQEESTLQIASNPWSEILFFDPHNQITRITIQDPGGQLDQYFYYDEQQQLTHWNDSTGKSCEYVYDPLGNRIQEYEVDSLNQTLSKGSIKYTYDPNGNLISRQEKEHLTLFYYDALDRLVCREIPFSFKTEYTYDGYHRRQTSKDSIWEVEKKSWKLTSSRNYLYLGNEEIGSFDDQGNVQEMRILCNGPIKGIGATRFIELPEGKYYAIHDLQGNIRCLVDIETGKGKEYYRFSPFGEEEIYNEFRERISSESAINPWRFSAKRTDHQGYVDFGKRVYFPEIGKWMTLDPFGFPDGHNRYVFAKNNPLNYTDPHGYFSTPIFIGKLQERMNDFFQAFKEYSKASDFDQNMQEFVRFFIGKGLFSISNYATEPPALSSVKGIFPSSKKKVTFINGIMNSKGEMDQILENISQWPEYKNEDIYSIYRGTGGWTKDILKATLIKFGYVSDNAKELAKIWKKLLQEADEIDHWAHSVGGTETLRARNLLTPEEQKRINVITLGSATVIPDVGFKKVINHMSYRDGVCYLDPIGFLHALIYKPPHVDFKGSILDGYPFVDHLFAVYWKYLKEVLENE